MSQKLLKSSKDWALVPLQLSNRTKRSSGPVTCTGLVTWSLSFAASSMTELEKDISSLKSGLKGVEGVSEFGSFQLCLQPQMLKECAWFAGASVPAGSVPSGSGGQVCVGGQSVPDSGLLQLL